MKDRNIQTIHTDWSGIRLRIRYERNWPNSDRPIAIAHLEIEAVAPAHEPLPITETGYRSHFCAPQTVDEMGGPLGYVLAWLDAEAKSPLWKAAVQARRQLSLFWSLAV
jgi:hypothetical protein